MMISPNALFVVLGILDRIGRAGSVRALVGFGTKLGSFGGGAQAAGDVNGVMNTATASGEDPYDNPVESPEDDALEKMIGLTSLDLSRVGWRRCLVC